MINSINLKKEISNYMKFMSFIKSASPLTLKHYALDLDQTFNNDNYSYLSKEFWTQEDLMSAVRQAFNRWSHLSLASRNRKAATLKSFFSWAFSEGLTETDLSFQVTCPKVPKKIPHFLSVDEAIAVLKSFDNQDTVVPLQEKILFLLLYGTGLRISEACALRWEQVNLEQRTLRVKGKGSKERLVAIPQLTFKILKEWRSESSSNEFVLGTTPLHTRVAYNYVRKSGVRAGLLKPLHPHALRHSFATHLLSSGANLRTLQALLGHESLQATEKYTHLGIDQLARTMESMHPLGKLK